MSMEDLIADGWTEFRQYHAMLIEHEMRTLAMALGMCDSELERTFLITYMNHCHPRLYTWTIPPPDPRKHGRFFIIDNLDGNELYETEKYFCRIEAQREIDIESKHYRIDFLFTLNRHSESPVGDPTVIARVAVELDGHDFHERTKDQAARDRSRDRAFLRDGIQVLRFTGSEVYKDPDKAVSESRKFIQSFIPSAETSNV